MTIKEKWDARRAKRMLRLDAERKRMRTLLVVHQGDATAIAKSQSMTRQGVMDRIRTLGLSEDLDLQRKVPEQTKEVHLLLSALARSASYDEAAKILGVSRITVYRRAKACGITADQVKRMRGTERRA